MATFTEYTDVATYLATHALGAVETASLIGGNTTIASAVTAGAVALPVASVAGLPVNSAGAYILTIHDGANSETVSATTPATGATLTLAPPGTVFAHAAGVNVTSAGTSGDLGALVGVASGFAENICRQGPDGGTDRSLYATSRTERLYGPSSARASFDTDGALVLRPYHWPIQSSPAPTISIQMGASVANTIDTTFLVLPGGARTLWVPQPQVVGATLPTKANWIGAAWPRNIGFVATLVYTGGPCLTSALSSVPSDLRTAVHFILSDLLGYRRNPTGAAMTRLGDQTLEARLRGDTSGNSILMIQARALLTPYTALPGM